MIQMMKKPVSIFLAVLMVFSCFSGVSLTALAADEVSENISLVASVSSNLSTISGTHYSVSCGYMVADDKGMRVNSFGALTINARKGETISKVILSYSEGGYRNTLSASIGTFDGNSTITGINAQQVSISSTSTAGVIISAVTVYFEGSLSNPTVTLTGGANAKSSGGLLTQSYLPGAMDTVTYTALTGAAFPEFETYTLNGVTVERTSDTVVTISGTPTANTEITVPDAESSSKIVTWNSATISSISSSITKDYTYTANGITLNKTGKGKFANNNITGYDSTASFEFTTATGKFTSIEIETSEIYNGGNWTKDGNTLKWNGTPSNSVSLSGSGLYLEGVSSITFVIKPNTYTVTWQNEDGSVLETDTDVAEGTVPTYDGATPNKADDAQYTYTFAGWTPEVVAATADATYTAQFTQVPKFSVFVKKLTGGTITVSNVTGLTTVAQLKDLLVTETGVPASAMRLIFAGKQLADDKTLGEYNIQKESTIHLIISTYTITWKSDEATIIDTTNVAYGETPTHADPADYEDADYTYTFAGWTPEVVAATADATYTATFTATPKPHNGVNLTVGNDITSNYYVDYSKYPGAQKIRYSYNCVNELEQNVQDGATIALDEIPDEMKDATSGRFVLEVSQAPAQMAEPTVIEILDGNNQVIDTLNYSAKSYCDKVLGMSDDELAQYTAKGAELRKLCHTMIAYGQAAQGVFTDYTEHYITDETRLTCQSDAVIEQINNATATANHTVNNAGQIKFAGVSFVCTKDARLRFYLNTSEATSTPAAPTASTGNAALKYTLNGAEKQYFVEVSGINAADFNEQITVNYGGSTIKLSVLDFAGIVLRDGSGASAALQHFAKTLVVYNTNALAFFGN